MQLPSTHLLAQNSIHIRLTAAARPSMSGVVPRSEASSDQDALDKYTPLLRMLCKRLLEMF